MSTHPTLFYESLLSALDMVVLQRSVGRIFLAPTGAPAWLLGLGAVDAGDKQFRLDGHATFLTSFLTDAEQFWVSGVGGRAGSGLWSERSADNSERHFEAFAVRTGALELLLVSRLPDAEYEQRQAPLQAARAAMLRAENQAGNASRARKEAAAVAAHARARALSSRPMVFDALHYDAQTGLPGRVLFMQRLASQFEQLQRPRQTLCVLLVAIDGYDALCSSSEEDAMTLVLRQFALRLRGCLRQTDTAARLSDNEFGLLVTLGDDAQDAALRVVRELLSSLRPAFDSGTDHVPLTVSVGGALSPRNGGSGRELHDSAEAALRDVITRGGDHYRFAIDEADVSNRGELVLDSELRRALERSEFVLHYHPRMTMSTKTKASKIMGAEALLRWESPQRGLVGPGQIIPFAERTGLIIAIGEWVLHEACTQWQAWQSQGLRGLKLSVNLSVHQLEHPDVVNMVARALDESGLDPALLELEITESAAMNNIDQCIPTLHALKRLGVTISIDDFGSGHSSFAYLKRLPVDALKIDRSFVTDLALTDTDAAIVAAIVTVAHQLQLSTVAEGVTDADQVSVLAELGCDEMQGFLFSQPLPAKAFETWAKQPYVHSQ
jgi:diguanylate cyclase (GGDEF)-like protein